MRLLTSTFFLFLTFSLFGIKPDREYKHTPDSYEIEYEANRVLTNDGFELNTWTLLPSEELDKDTTIIIAYGDAGNMSHFLYHANIFRKQGYTIVMFDYRGFGKSSDFEINKHYLYYNEYSRDLEAIIDWTSQNVKNDKTGIWSFSMGTIITTISVQNKNVDFIVAEGFVSNPVMYKERVFDLKQKEIFLPNNSDLYERYVENISSPILLVSGSGDKFTTTEDSRMVVNQKSNRKLLKFDGDHFGGIKALTINQYGDKYVSEVESFIETFVN